MSKWTHEDGMVIAPGGEMFDVAISHEVDNLCDAIEEMRASEDSALRRMWDAEIAVMRRRLHESEKERITLQDHIIATQEALAVAKPVMRRAHDLLDDMNADENGGRMCLFCLELGYDGNGLRHADDCILIEARSALQRIAALEEKQDE